MKKNYKLLALALIAVLSISMVFTSCGGPSTFEEYVKDNDELKSQLDSLSTSNSQGSMTVEFKGNDINYVYKFTEPMDEALVDTVKETLEEQMDSYGATFEQIAQTCEEESEIDGIKVNVKYLDGDDTELYSGTFE